MTCPSPGFYIDGEKLPAFGANTARRLKLAGETSSKRMAREVWFALAHIRRVHDRLEEKYRSFSEIPQSAEWVLDNWYLAQREGKYAAADIKAAAALRMTEDGALLAEACGALVRCGEGEVTEARLEAFLDGFQTVCPLSREELSIFAPSVKAALVIYLKELCGEFPSKISDAQTEKSLAAVFTSLRLLATLDLSELLERVDLTERLLRQDPAGIYPLMDERTRDLYRREVTRLSKRAGTDEQRLARTVLEFAQNAEGEKNHVGYWIFTRPLGNRKKERSGGFYISANILLTLFLALLAGFLTDSAAGALLLVIPVSELVKNLIDSGIMKNLPPRRMPRMELEDGVPDEGKTICVVSALITSRESGPELARRLEEFRLVSRDCGKNLLFGVLADLPEAREKSLPGDADAIEAAKAAIDALNDRYGGGYYLLCRHRAFISSDRRWQGRDRKRGAVLALSRLLTGAESEINMISGDGEALRGARYILTLDTDTRLSPGAAKELIGAMLHPLNAPVVDERQNVVVSGHGIIHPRMAVDLASATASDFARVFAGQGGTDPYGSSCGELYMDLFERGGFAGKGIIDAAALLRCTGRLPENRILSHDAIEGAYLRGGFMSDTELTDGFPSTSLSYFRRMHRWVRGDWQNAAFIFRKGKALSDVDRWKLADSIRRSLVAPLTFAAIFVGFFLPEKGLALASAAALLALASRLLLTLAESYVRHGDNRTRYHSTVIHGVGGALVQTALRLVLLPAEAWVCAAAAATALWRMGVTHRNLLSWQTAAQAESSHKKGLGAYLSLMWFSVLAGAAAVLLPASVIGHAAGVIWIAAPFIAAALGRGNKRARPVPERSRAYLTARAGEMWKYFETYCRKGDHFLPPDNWQEQPPVGVAHRTSPTNIGLALVSALAALDLALTDKDRALTLIDNILSSVEALPKWRGHLYNWYDTKKFKCLNPLYVSTVDSGNLAACLIVLRAGAEDYGRPDLASRADALYRAMDFTPLYDTSRRLFRIGYDVTADEASKGLYDLLASEARLSGYVAIAKGDVSRRHWRQLSRALVQKDGYRGMASWTGTMFEYLMPELFLPLCRDSLLWESAEFCMYVQRKKVSGGVPWGTSESAFFSLDPSLSYRYKAHGCAGLALKRGMDEELVVSPYSSFLALVIEPDNAVKNLRKLESLGALGRFGFWEAVDFTPSRCRFRSGETVRCVMAHHLGMSLAAVDNYLSGGKLQERFMRDPAMAAYRGFLEEKVPVGSVLLHRRGEEPPEKPSHAIPESWEKHGEGTDAETPECCLLSNGSYSIMLTESGCSTATAGGIGIYRGPFNPLSGPAGVSLYIETESGRRSLVPSAGETGGLNFSWSFSGGGALFTGNGERLSTCCSCAVSARDLGETRFVEIMSPDALKGRLYIEFEPMLAYVSDYLNHPAFWRLGMHAQMRNGVLLLRRLPRGELPGGFLCLASDLPMEISANRDGAALGWLSAPMVRASVPLDLPAGGAFSSRFAICFGADADETYDAVLRTLAMGPADFADLPSACAALYGMTAKDIAAAMGMVSKLAFPRPAGEVREGREALWCFGISGDYPILCASLDSEQQLPAARALLCRHALLRACGLKCDLVFLNDEGGDYRRALSRSVGDTLEKLGLGAFSCVPGGVHIADSQSAGPIVQSCAAAVVKLSAPETPRPRQTGKNYLASLPARKGGKVRYGWSEEGAFWFDVDRELPARSWGNVLTNGTFGFFATDAGTGSMWFKNAREFRINRWLNDPYAAAGTETLETASGAGRTSLFAAEDGHPCRVEFGCGWASWDKDTGGGRVKVTAFVPQNAAERVLIVEGAHREIYWRTDLVMTGDERDAPFVVTNYVNHVLGARNARSPYPETAFMAAFSAEPLGFTCDLAAWRRGETDGRTGAGLYPCFGAVLPPAETIVIVCGCCEEETLRALAEPEAARAALEDTKKYWADVVGRLRIKTPDGVLDRFFNGWAAYQALACRLLGRCSLYQSGGAYGFRDQLQDAVNLILLDPSYARRQIVSSCAHQYEEGDVMHWWHPQENGDKGVRTRCSDDLVWLPWAVCEYVEKTGDTALLAETVDYIASPALGEDERSRYEQPQQSGRREDVLTHASRALAKVLERGAGAHGLLLMGGGDWNDGMDLVGAAGSGESVWLTWFFAATARRFSAILENRGRKNDAAALLSAAKRYGREADRAWDGAWYLRGWYDDGAPLGSEKSTGCKIDSLAQSWAAFCGEASPDKLKTALDSSLKYLFDREGGIVKLFDPPFGDGGENAGYIRSYGPGFRENGGQYTHGALWLASACLREGRAEDGWAILRATLGHEGGTEPFVLAADVYANRDRYGEDGWSWYTGSAGWFFRIAAEELLGLRLRDGKLEVSPSLPGDWDGFSAVWTDPAGEAHEINFTRPEGPQIHK